MESYKIKSIKAKEIRDSRGKPTVEVELKTPSFFVRASVPSGTSKGKYEAVAKPAKLAVKNVNKIISPRLIDKDLTKQKAIDDFLIKLDGTKNKSRLGANAILPVSMAVCRAGAKAQKIPLWKWLSKIAAKKPSLPAPCVLFMEGGLHGRGKLDIQEFMAVFPGQSFREKFKKAMATFQSLGKILPKKYGIEGAFSPSFKNTKEALDLLIKVGKKKKIKIILDVAASHSRLKRTPEYYLKVAKEYPILGIEDPFRQDDWQNWKKLNSKTESLFIETKVKKRKKSSSPILIIGDDLTVTNPERIKLAKKRKACSGVIIKPNQIGTVTETIEAANLAKSFGWKIIVSHRSGETLDDFIADLAVGVEADFIKSGAPFPKERMAKYNRLIQIEKELKK